MMFSVYYSTPRDEALRVLVLIDGHPKRLAALSRFYKGRHDVLDALWWRLHPLETSPRGTLDPASERHALQRQAYSRHDENSPLVADRDLLTGEEIRLSADELCLRNFDVALTADARALDRAVAKFTKAYPTNAPDDIQNFGVTTAAEPVVAASRRRGQWLPVVAGAVIVLLLVTTGALWGKLQEVSDRLDATDTATSDPVESWRETTATTLAALLVFNRTQTLDDVYPLQLPIAYDIRTVRQLKPYNSGGAYRLFGALAEPDQVCLVVVLADLSSSSSCVSDDQFARTGLTLTTHASRTGTGDSPAYISHRITWQPDGSFTSNAGTTGAT